LKCFYFCSVCNPNPCANGGQCVVLLGNTDYSCQCPVGLTLGGKNCDVLITTTLPR